MSAFPSLTLPYGTSSTPLSPQDIAVNQNFLGPNYFANGTSIDSNTLALASLRNPYLQQNPYASASYDTTSYLNPYADLSTYGYDDPARLQQAKNEVPLARIGLQQFQQQLAFQDRSETRQLGFQNKSEQRQLAFVDRESVRDLGLQERQLKLLDKKDERGFFGNLLGTIVPSVIGLIANNQQGAREERMFKYAQANKVDDIKDEYRIKSLKDRIAQLERKLDRYKDDDEDERSVKKSKKRKVYKRKDDDDAEIRTVDRYGDSSWVVVKSKSTAKSSAKSS